MSLVLIRQLPGLQALVAVFFCFAQRNLCASAILFLASALMVRLFRADFGGAGLDIVFRSRVASSLRACSRRSISLSSKARMLFTLIDTVYIADMEFRLPRMRAGNSSVPGIRHTTRTQPLQKDRIIGGVQRWVCLTAGQSDFFEAGFPRFSRASQ